MELFDSTLTQGKGGRYLFRQCEAVDILRAHAGNHLGVIRERCGADAMRGVTWERFEDTHTLLVCDRHALKFVEPVVQEAN
jgi:hypothetical protein